MRRVIWVAVFLVFVWLGITRLDPDFGWHVKMGEYILGHGIPKTDPFSYTMANFPFVDHEWLTNVIMYLTYQVVGKVGMAIMAALGVGVAAFVAVPSKWKKWAGVPAMLAFSVWWPRAGVRPQIEDWIFLAVILRLVGEEEIWKKWKWGLPVLMLVWANLHGGFAVGLVVAGTIWLVKTIENKKINWVEVAVLGVSGLVTLINPYGGRLWGEVLQQITDRKVGKVIAEWQPFYAEVELGWLFLAVWTGMLSFRYGKKMEKWKLVVVASTFLASMSSLRHAALFAVVAIPVCAEATGKFYEEFKKHKIALQRLQKFYTGILILAGLIFAVTVGITMVNPATRLGETDFYPVKAISFLRTNGVKGRLYAEYGWGGYLDWKYPEQKIFIDGRMATWKWKSPDPTYSDYVFDEYLDLVFRGKWQKWTDKYGIETMMLPAPRTWILRKWFEDQMMRVGINFSIQSANVGLAIDLEKAGWVKVYSDEVAVIYKKP